MNFSLHINDNYNYYKYQYNTTQTYTKNFFVIFHLFLQFFYFCLRKVHRGNVKHRFATAHDYRGTPTDVTIYTIALVHVGQNRQTGSPNP